MQDPKRAVVLLSGGLDSATTMAIAAHRAFEVHALSFRYGQRHEVEIECARRQAQKIGAVAHEIVDLTEFGRLIASSSALIRGSDIGVPKDRDVGKDEIPATYVPGRNLLFLSYAVAWAEALGASHVFIGVNAIDYSGYPDCRPEFIAAMQRAASLGTRSGVLDESSIVIETPLQDLRKDEIIVLGVQHGIDYADTVSCYEPDLDDLGRALACGRCDSCQLRRSGFEQADVPDPTVYRDEL